jgi:LEA14-like dessication related protein
VLGPNRETMKWIKNLALVFSLSVMLSACSYYNDVQVLKVMNIEIVEFSTDIINATVEIEINNPNWYDIKLMDSDLDLFVNGKSMGTVHLAEKVVIPKKSITIQKVEVISDIKDAQANFLQSVMSLLFKKTALLEIKGEVKAKGLMVSKKIPVEIKEEMDIRDFGL